MNIVWGPFNHQDTDRWLERELTFAQASSFGPFGAQKRYRPDLKDTEFIQSLKQTPPDLLVVIDPHSRLVGPELWTVPCPIVACTSFYPYSAEQWQHFDGLLPLGWLPADEISRQLPVGRTLSLWAEEPRLREPKDRLIPLLCVGTSAALQVKQYGPQQAFFVEEGPRLYHWGSQSEVAWIESDLNAALTCWAAGAKVLVSQALGELLAQFLIPGVDFLSAPAFREELRQQALTLQPQSTWSPLSFQETLVAIWPDVQQRARQRVASAVIPDLASLWAFSPIQIEAMPLLDLPWLHAAAFPRHPLPERLPIGAGEKLSAAYRAQAEQREADAKALVEALLFEENWQGEAFPVPNLLSSSVPLLSFTALAQLCVWRLYLALPGIDLGLLLHLPVSPILLKSEIVAACQAQPDLLSSEVAHWLLLHFEGDVELRLLLHRYHPSLVRPDETWALAQCFVERRGLLTDIAFQILPEAQSDEVLWESQHLLTTQLAKPFLPQHLVMDLGQVTSELQPLWPQRPSVLISHRHVLRTALQGSAKWIAVLPWSYGELPFMMQKIALEQLDEVWVYSDFAADSFIRAGYPAARVACLPPAVSDVFDPVGPVFDLPQAKKQRVFVRLAGLSQEQIRFFFQAYRLAAQALTDISLLCVCTQNQLEEVPVDLLKDLDVVWLQQPTDANMWASLLRAGHVWMQFNFLQEGEAALCQAMASGLAVVVPEQGPVSSLCSNKSAWFVPTQAHFLRRDHHKIRLQVTAGQSTLNTRQWEHSSVLPSFLYEPIWMGLVACLREILSAPDQWPVKGQAAYQEAQAYRLPALVSKVKARLAALPPHARRLQEAPRLIKLYMPADFPEPWFQHTTELPIERVSELAQADLCLSHRPEPTCQVPQILYLSEPSSDLSLNCVEIWGRRSQDMRPFVESGFEPERCFVLPLMVDFERFKPFVLPQYQDAAAGILCITPWAQKQWALLLQALRLVRVKVPLQLTLIPLGASAEQIQADISAFLKQFPLPKGLRLQAQSLPTRSEDVQKLYQAHSCFVETSPVSSGQFHLMAQAMGMPCVGRAQQSFLRAPYAEVYQGQGPQELAVRIQSRLEDPRSIFDALAVREHLRHRHDTAALEQILSTRLRGLCL